MIEKPERYVADKQSYNDGYKDAMANIDNKLNGLEEVVDKYVWDNTQWNEFSDLTRKKIQKLCCEAIKKHIKGVTNCTPLEKENK